jgi:hypothetical protein
MKRQMRKSGKKLSPLWDDSMDFEVAIRPLRAAELDDDLEGKIIMLPLPNAGLKFPHAPTPPMAA